MNRNYRDRMKKTSILKKTGDFMYIIFRLLLGFLFVFSGFVKAIDPLGFTYKIQDYLLAFGGPFVNLSVLAFVTSIALSTFEILLGLNLIFKVKIRLTLLSSLVFMLVMTLLTLYIAIANPVTDCGCFGDAFVISNWATFYKNLVIDAIIVLLIALNKKIKPFFLPRIESSAITVFILIAVGLSVYSYQHLPMFDFLPYKIGVNIPQAMLIPENAPTDKYNTTFIYSKNGQQREFTLENYPKGDSTWVFVDQKSVLVSKGYQAPIHDFTIVNSTFDDITEKVLYYQGYTYLLVMYDLSKTSEDGAKQAEIMYQNALSSGIKFYALTGSSDEDIQNFIQKTSVTFPFCKTDPTTLKTIIRANPGLVLLKNGTIVGKWNWRDFI